MAVIMSLPRFVIFRGPSMEPSKAFDRLPQALIREKFEAHDFDIQTLGVI